MGNKKSFGLSERLQENFFLNQFLSWNIFFQVYMYVCMYFHCVQWIVCHNDK